MEREILLVEDDAAPDSKEHFSEGLGEITGYSLEAFFSLGEKLDKLDGDSICYRLNGYVIHKDTSSPFWELIKPNDK